MLFKMTDNASFSIAIAIIAFTAASNEFPVSNSVSKALNKMLYEDDECTSAWPNVTHCIDWWTDSDDNMRYCLSNSIPPYPVEPYCPFGVGKGYCMTGENHDECQQFKGMECPAQPGTHTHRHNYLHTFACSVMCFQVHHRLEMYQ